MKRLMLTVVLTCVLSAQVLAGEIPSGGIAPPPPNPTSSTSPGEIPIVGAAEKISDAALSAVLTVFGLLS